MQKHIPYFVFVSLNVIRVAERKCEIFQNFIHCSLVAFLTADMLSVFSSSILRIPWHRINFRTIPHIVSESAVVTCEKLEISSGSSFLTLHIKCDSTRTLHKRLNIYVKVNKMFTTFTVFFSSVNGFVGCPVVRVNVRVTLLAQKGL
jgi:uncharacterized membrane protein